MIIPVPDFFKENTSKLTESTKDESMSKADFKIEEHEMTLEEIKAVLEEYERQYGMSSQEFYEKWKRGEAYWVSDSVDWSGLFRAYIYLNGRDSSHLEG
jgi:hypothetical protein